MISLNYFLKISELNQKPKIHKNEKPELKPEKFQA